MANNYGKFVPYFSIVAVTRYKLSQKDVPFTWGTSQQTAFETIRKCLASDNVLTHYNSIQEIGLSADAHAYGLGAVLFHTDAI